MAGHSKWAQIKRSKAVVDAKRGALFTRLGREIMVSARAGADPAGNFQLRTAIEKARAAGMPNSNIERAIAKGSGQLSGGVEAFEAVRYEGYGPGGVAVLVEALTDNRNRTAADLRLAFGKHGGNLGESGCVGYLFEARSVARLRQGALDEEQLLEALLALESAGAVTVLGYELGLDDGADGEATDETCDKAGDAAAGRCTSTEVFAPFAQLEALQDGLRRQGLAVGSWEHRWIPLVGCPLSDPGQLGACLRMLDTLEELDDVRTVTSNLEAEGALLDQLLA